MGVKDLMALTKGTVKPLKDWDMKDKWIEIHYGNVTRTTLPRITALDPTQILRFRWAKIFIEREKGRKDWTEIERKRSFIENLSVVQPNVLEWVESKKNARIQV